MKAPAPLLMSGPKLCKHLGVSRYFVAAIRRASAGDKDNPFRGNYAHPQWLMDWLKNHPEFTPSSK